MTDIVVVTPDKSPFFDIFFQKLPYPVAAGIVRGIKVGLSFIIAAIAAGIANGSLISGIGIIPPEYTTFATLVLTSAIISAEKYLRENGLINDTKDLPTSTVSDTGPVDYVVPVPAITDTIPTVPTTTEGTQPEINDTPIAPV